MACQLKASKAHRLDIRFPDGREKTILYQDRIAPLAQGAVILRDYRVDNVETIETSVVPQISEAEAAHKAEVKRQRAEKKKDKQITVRSGYLYGIFNPAWPTAVKVGKEIDEADREADYDVGCPNDDYGTVCRVFVKDRHKAEKEAHAALAEFRTCWSKKKKKKFKNEWFHAPHDRVRFVFEDIRRRR